MSFSLCVFIGLKHSEMLRKEIEEKREKHRRRERSLLFAERKKENLVSLTVKRLDFRLVSLRFCVGVEAGVNCSLL